MQNAFFTRQACKMFGFDKRSRTCSTNILITYGNVFSILCSKPLNKTLTEIPLIFDNLDTFIRLKIEGS